MSHDKLLSRNRREKSRIAGRNTEFCLWSLDRRFLAVSREFVTGSETGENFLSFRYFFSPGKQNNSRDRFYTSAYSTPYFLAILGTPSFFNFLSVLFFSLLQHIPHSVVMSCCCAQSQSQNHHFFYPCSKASVHFAPFLFEPLQNPNNGTISQFFLKKVA